MILCEVSFEVCNKVGGIYTVVTSKAKEIAKQCDRHICIGPWLDTLPDEFLQAKMEEVPQDIQLIFDMLSKQGIFCTYGRWNIHGNPETILINYKTFANDKNYYKAKYWELYKIDSLYSRWDFEEPLVFSTAAGKFIESLAAINQGVVGQFHEWITGFGLLYLKMQESKVRCVFTTHATMLGRTLTSRNIDVLKLQKHPDEYAREYGVIEKHTTEKACANAADVFTTVSDITAKEAEVLLGKKPQVLTYNGLDLSDFPHNNEILLTYHTSRRRLNNFLESYFKPHSNFNANNTTVLYTSGRPEFENKGFLFLLEALAKLNKQTQRSIVCIFFVPWQHYTIKESVSRKLQGIDTIRNDNAELCTHNIENEEQQQLIQKCYQLGLDNRKENNVKIIWYPLYLGTKEEIIFKRSYYDIIAGCDLGIFASTYEPWGYTPLESMAVGIPTITANTSGFGQFMAQYKPTLSKGLVILNRKNNLKADEELNQHIQEFMRRVDQDGMRLAAAEFAQVCDWKKFIQRYMFAYTINLGKKE